MRDVAPRNGNVIKDSLNVGCVCGKQPRFSRWRDLTIHSLKRACTYDTSLPPPEKSPDSSEPSRGLNSEPPASFLLSEEGIKAATMRRFSETTPEDVATGYYGSIQTWFPIISFSELCARLPRTWEQVSTDMCLLFMSMSLLRQVPETQIMGGNFIRFLIKDALLYLEIREIIIKLEIRLLEYKDYRIYKIYKKLIVFLILLLYSSSIYILP